MLPSRKQLNRAAGRPPGSEGIRAATARRAKEAIEALAEVVVDANAPADARVRAAEVLLTHAIKTS
jgi:uncharacterized protein (UPF0147 family)